MHFDLIFFIHLSNVYLVPVNAQDCEVQGPAHHTHTHTHTHARTDFLGKSGNAPSHYQALKILR